MRQILNRPLGPLLLFSIALTALLTTYVAAGLAPSPSFEVVASLSWSLLLALWIVADARRHTGIPCFDFGFYCYVFLPFVFPWYCFWSRGWRGALTLMTIACLWAVPFIIASIVWRVLYR
jgi:hypothetical protein